MTKSKGGAKSSLNKRVMGIVEKAKNEPGWVPDANEAIDLHLATMSYLSDTFEKRRKKSGYTKLQQADHDLKTLKSFLANPDLAPLYIEELVYCIEERGPFKYCFVSGAGTIESKMSKKQKKFWGID